MPVKLKPYKLVCTKCGHSKIVSPKSDALTQKDLMDMNPICPKCKKQMEIKSVDRLDMLIDGLFGMFKK